MAMNTPSSPDPAIAQAPRPMTRTVPGRRVGARSTSLVPSPFRRGTTVELRTQGRSGFPGEEDNQTGGRNVVDKVEMDGKGRDEEDVALERVPCSARVWPGPRCPTQVSSGGSHLPNEDADKVRPLRAPRSWRMPFGIIAASAFGIAFATGSAPRTPTPAAGASQSARRVIQHTSLCASAETVNRLVVRRTDAFPQNHLRFSFPATVAVTEVAAVRSVARALCALPAMPEQAMHCPVDFGIAYHLEFSRGQQRFPVVTLDATGCQSVHGLVVERWTARSPGFWRTLGAALHLENASWATFRGAGPSG